MSAEPSRLAVAIPDPAPIAPAKHAHLPALDGVRGLAILLVLAHNLQFLDEPHGIIANVLGHALDAGWIGVQLFFVLSGLLITGILLDSRTSASYYRGFYARRSLRIFPLYYAVLFVVFVALPLVGHVPANVAAERPHQLWLWLYVSNWTAPYGLSGQAFPHFWSLSVEEQFYLVWPFLIRRCKSVESALRLCIVVAIVGLVGRCALLAAGFSSEALYQFTIGRIDALALGGAGAALLRMPRWRSRIIAGSRRLLVASVVIGLAGFVVTKGYGRAEWHNQSYGYSILALTFALFVLATAANESAQPKDAAGSRWTRWLRNPVLRGFGAYSYSIYVFHKPFHDWVGMPLVAKLGVHDPSSVSATVLYFVVSSGVLYALGWITFGVFEQRFLALKRFFPSGT